MTKKYKSQVQPTQNATTRLIVQIERNSFLINTNHLKLADFGKSRSPGQKVLEGWIICSDMNYSQLLVFFFLFRETGKVGHPEILDKQYF